jgi:hypothetical protein
VTTFDNDLADFKGAHIDHLALRLSEHVREVPAAAVPFQLAAAPPTGQVIGYGCVLYGLVIVNLDAANQLVSVGGPGVTPTFNLWSDTLAPNVVTTPAALLIRRGIACPDGLSILSAGAVRGTAFILPLHRH